MSLLPPQLTPLRRTILFLQGMLLCLLALIAAPLWINSIVQSAIGPVELGPRHVAAEEISRAWLVQGLAIAVVFLFAAIAISRWVRIDNYAFAFWLANPLAIAASVFLFDNIWVVLETQIAEVMQIPYDQLLRTRAFLPGSAEVPYWLCAIAIVVSFFASWAGALVSRSFFRRALAA